jgi:hypothetical protein
MRLYAVRLRREARCGPNKLDYHLGDGGDHSPFPACIHLSVLIYVCIRFRCGPNELDYLDCKSTSEQSLFQLSPLSATLFLFVIGGAMCWSVHIASDVRLPLVPWVAAHPAFHVEATAPELVVALRSSLTKSYVYFVGAQGGCACDFQFELVPPADDADRLAATAARRARAALVDYLTVAVARGPIQFRAQWIVDEHLPSTRMEPVTPDFFLHEHFTFEDRARLTVVVPATI